MKPKIYKPRNAFSMCIMFGAVVAAGLAGCTLSTEVPLIPEEQGTVSRAFIGDWTGTNPGLDVVYHLSVRDLDGHRYVLGLRPEGSGDATLYTAVLVNIAGSRFAQIRRLDDAPKRLYQYGRVVSYGEDRFSFRELSSGFFSGDRAFDSSAKLRSIIAANVDNPDMYREEAWIATRVE